MAESWPQTQTLLPLDGGLAAPSADLAYPVGDVKEPPPLRLRVAVLSDVGRARDHQEDACAYIIPPDADLHRRKGELCLVADGMGGHSAGEVASAAAVQEIQRAYFAAPSDDMAAALRLAMQEANQAIYRLAQDDLRQRGMGSTATVAALRGREVHVASVGDSRAYLVREGEIVQITEDHSWVGAQVRAGILAPEEAQIHPQRNIITRALGADTSVEPDLFQGWLLPADVLVLCSDGLTVHVADGELREVVAGLDPETAARRLVGLANERGGSDNITVILIRAEPAAEQSKPASRQLPLLVIGGVAVILLLVILAIALLLFNSKSGPEPSPTAAPLATTVVSPFPGGIQASRPDAADAVGQVVYTRPSPLAYLQPSGTVLPLDGLHCFSRLRVA